MTTRLFSFYYVVVSDRQLSSPPREAEKVVQKSCHLKNKKGKK